MKEVGALTVIQPWAYVILKKGKNVENRQKNSHYRGAIAIHASSKKSKEWFDDCSIKLDPDKLTFGAVVGFANLVDVITKKEVTPKTKKWFGGKYGYVLSDVILLKKPVPMKGARGLWRLSGRALKLCLKQLTGKQIKKFKKFEKVHV